MGPITPNWIFTLHMSKLLYPLTVTNMWPSTHTVAYLLRNAYPYGLSSVPGIFPRMMDNLVKGILNTMVYLDDILITGSTEEEHLTALDQVLNCLKQVGFRLKRSKCSCMVSEVQYLGHKIDREGIHTHGDTLKAVQDAPAPTNVSELRSCAHGQPLWPISPWPCHYSSSITWPPGKGCQVDMGT